MRTEDDQVERLLYFLTFMEKEEVEGVMSEHRVWDDTNGLGIPVPS